MTTSPLDRILSRLPRHKQHGGGYMAPCPSHDDRNPSLSLREGRDGRVLIKCFAGCDYKDVVGALGLQTADLFSMKRIYSYAKNSGQKSI